MAKVEVKTHHWSRAQYDRLIETGFFQPRDPIELIGGQLVVAEPQGSHHFAGVRAVDEALRTAFGAGWDVRGQGPVALDDEFERQSRTPRSFRAASGTTWVATHHGRSLSSRSASRASLSIDTTRAASTRALGLPTTGS